MTAQFISSFGTILVLTAYALVTYKGVSPTSLAVSSLNIVGSLLLLATALILLNVGFVCLNIAWIAIAIISYRKARHGRSIAVVREQGDNLSSGI